jgi:cytochrome c
MRFLTNFAISIVLTLALVFGVRALADFIFAVERPAKPAIEVPMPEEEAKPEQAGKAEEQAAAAKEEPAATAAPASEEQQPQQMAAAESEPQAAAGGQTAAAPAGGDPEAGKKVFNKCKACHFVDREKNKVGPYLKGVVGRPAAAVEGFKYSEAMKAKAAEGLVWTEENLASYLKSPKKFIPGNKMAFAGLKKDKDIADVIAYLKSAQ